MAKKCTRCQRMKDKFPKQAAKKDGLSSWCTDCWSDYNKLRMTNEEYRAKVTKWGTENKRKYRRNEAFKIEERKRHLRYEHTRRARKLANGGSYTQEEWQALCGYYGNKCLACGGQDPLTVDHVIPISKGGSNDISNIQPLCKRCNDIKYDKTTDYR